MFIQEQAYTRKEIHDQLGGSIQSYLPSVKGHVVCACINRKYNPDAPRVILVGTGKGIERDGAMLASQKQAVPVFIKLGTNAWIFHGHFRVKRSSQQRSEIAKHQGGRDSDVTRIIYLEPSEPDVSSLQASEFLPTTEDEELDRRTREALNAPFLPKPAGQKTPRQISREGLIYERDPLVRAFVLRRAKGQCECCREEAPFVDLYGVPFLEVHHIHPLAEGGADVVENAAAICPNCHRECHHGRDATALVERLTQFVQKLSFQDALIC